MPGIKYPEIRLIDSNKRRLILFNLHFINPPLTQFSINVLHRNNIEGRARTMINSDLVSSSITNNSNSSLKNTKTEQNTIKGLDSMLISTNSIGDITSLTGTETAPPKDSNRFVPPLGMTINVWNEFAKDISVLKIFELEVVTLALTLNRSLEGYGNPIFAIADGIDIENSEEVKEAMEKQREDLLNKIQDGKIKLDNEVITARINYVDGNIKLKEKYYKSLEKYLADPNPKIPATPEERKQMIEAVELTKNAIKELIKMKAFWMTVAYQS